MAARSSKTILLVEDNDNDAVLARAAFARCGVPHVLVAAEDGVAALEYLCAAPPCDAAPPGPDDRGPDDGGASRPATEPLRPLPDLVLLDLKLPGIDGFEVLRRVRADERLRGVAVVVFTSSVEESDIDRSLRGGANSYVRKPVDFDEFLEVARVLSRYWLELHQAPRAEATARAGEAASSSPPAGERGAERAP